MLSSMAAFVSNALGDGVSAGGVYVTLGLDIGTSSVKAVIVQSQAAGGRRSSLPSSPSSSSSTPQPSPSPTPPPWLHSVLSFHSAEHEHPADLSSSYSSSSSSSPSSSSSSLRSEQDPTRLLLAVVACVRALPAEHRRRVEYVGVSCAMHGMVMWADRDAPAYVLELMDSGATAAAAPSRPPPHSAFIDWRDGRCSADFLAALNAGVPQPSPSTPPLSGQWLSSGFGCATLAHIAHASPHMLHGYTRASTIGDYLVWLLMNTRGSHDAEANAARSISYPAYIHNTSAASWGMFEQEQSRWQTDRAGRANIPARLLPTVLVTAPLFPISAAWVQWLGLGPHCQVSVAVGDAAASVWAVNPSPQQLVLYVGTSAQLLLVTQHHSAAQQQEEEEGEGDDRQVEGEEEGEEGGAGVVEATVYGEPSVSAASSTAATRAEGEERSRNSRRAVVDFVLPPPPPSAFSSASTAFPSPSLAAPSSLPSCEYRPYFDGRRVLVCASMTGGNAFDWLARSVQLLHAQLNAPALLSPSSPHAYSPLESAPHPLEHYYRLLLLQGYQHIPLPPSLDFHPAFLPERWSPSTPPSLTFLSSSPSSLSLGSLSSSLCRGVVRHLKASMLRSAGPRERRRLGAVQQLLGVGGALRRNGLFRVWAEREWGRPVVLAQPLPCDWKRAEMDRDKAKSRVRTGVAGGGGGAAGELRVDVDADARALSAAEAADEGGYHRDAAFGAAILGLERLLERRQREQKAAEAGRL